MNENLPIEPPAKRPLHWPSLLQFVLSGLGLLAAWGLALFLCLAILLQLTASRPPELLTQASIYGINWGFAGVLMIAGMITSAARLLDYRFKAGKSWSALKKIFHPVRLILFWPLLLVAGYFAAESPYRYLLLPPIHIVAISIPLIWLLWLGIRKLPKGSAQRDLGAFNAGLMMGPMLAVTLEIAAILVFSIMAGIYIAGHPDLMSTLERFAMQFMSANMDSDELMAIVGQLLNNRITIGISLGTYAVVIPLIEEAFKPIGVWLLAGRKLKTVDGFVLGMIGGAGFAAFEFLNAYSPDVPWPLLVGLRTTTSAMHMATGGLVGAALADAWSNRRYLRLAASYALAVAIHGLWNAAAVVYGVSNLLHTSSAIRQTPVLPQHLVTTSLIMMVFMVCACFALLVGTNSYMSKKVVVEYAAGQVNELDNSEGATQSDATD